MSHETVAELSVGAGSCTSSAETGYLRRREQVEAAVTGYLEAFADCDGEEACRNVAERAQRDLAAIADARSCADAHEALDDEQRDKLHDSRVARIRIDGGWKAVAFGSGGGYRTRAEGECTIGGMDEFDDGGGHAFWRREGRADFRDFIVETCRRADRQGILTEDGGEAEQRAFNRIAGRVIVEMAERGQIRALR